MACQSSDPLVSSNDHHISAIVMEMSAELEPMALNTSESTTSNTKLAKATTAICGLNLKELWNAEIWRAAIVELIFSATAIFLSISAFLACFQRSDQSSPRLLIALLHVAIFSSCFMAAGPLSGGHVTPCITLVCMITGSTSPIRGIMYILAQIVGGCLGAAFVEGIVAPEITTKYALAGCVLRSTTSTSSSGIGILPGLLSEFCFTFILLFIIFPIALDPGSSEEAGPIVCPILIGFIIGMLIFISAGFSGVKDYGGAAMNPARCFGPAIIAAGKDDVMWHGHWIFWVGPFSASILVGVFYCAIPLDHAHIYSMKLDIFTRLKRKILN